MVVLTERKGFLFNKKAFLPKRVRTSKRQSGRREKFQEQERTHERRRGDVASSPFRVLLSRAL